MNASTFSELIAQPHASDIRITSPPTLAQLRELTLKQLDEVSR